MQPTRGKQKNDDPGQDHEISFLPARREKREGRDRVINLL